MRASAPPPVADDAFIQNFLSSCEQDMTSLGNYRGAWREQADFIPLLHVCRGHVSFCATQEVSLTVARAQGYRVIP